MTGSKKAMQAVAKKGVGKALKKGAAAIDVTAVVRELAETHAEYKKVAEQEQTKRRLIAAQERVLIEQIQGQREALMTYLDRSFDERRENFANFFAVLDKAVEHGDSKTVAATLGSIVQLAQSGPFKDVASAVAVKGVLGDPDKQFEF